MGILTARSVAKTSIITLSKMSSYESDIDMVKYPYQLIEFIAGNKKSDKKGLAIVDFVPSEWISFDSERGLLTARFLPPPYTKSTRTLLCTLMKNTLAAPNNFPAYPVKLRGEAKSYEEAIQRVERLNKEPYAYTTDSEVPAEKAKRIEKTFKKRSLKEMMSVPSITDPVSNDFSRSKPSKSTSRDSQLKTTTTTNRIEKLTSVKQTKSGSQMSVNKSSKRMSLSCVDGNPYSVPRSPRSNGHPRVEEEDLPRLDSNSDMLTVRSHHDRPQDSKTKTHNKETIQILTAIKELHVKVQKNTKAIDQLSLKLQNCKAFKENCGPTIDEFMENFKLVLPINNIKDFETFDSKLKSDKDLRESFIASLYPLNTENNVAKTVTSIIKKYISRDVAMQYTAVKHIAKKLLFKETYFCRYMMAAITSSDKNCKENAVTYDQAYQSLGACLSNAKDWDGYRKKRQPQARNNLTPPGHGVDSSSAED